MSRQNEKPKRRLFRKIKPGTAPGTVTADPHALLDSVASNTLLRSDDALFRKETRIYLRDCYDHTIQVIDMLENLREVTSGLIDLYHSSIGNKMNEIMKVLTLIATIFIPLSFIAGLYGMNFDQENSPWNMPELGLYFGDPLALMLMLIVAVGMLVFFRRKGWLGKASRKDQENG